MAVLITKERPSIGDGVKEWTCLSSDTKPTSAISGDIIRETDTSDKFEYDGNSWVQTSTAGAANSHLSSGIDSRGNYPETWYLEWAGTAGAADNAVIYTSVDVSMYNHHTITVSGTDPADVYVSVDGTTYDLMSVELTDDVTTGGGIKVVTIPTGKTGFFTGKFKNVRVIQDGATDSDAIGAHSVI